MSEFLTRVHILFGRDLFNNYVRFGTQKYRDEQTAREAYAYYPKGATFGYVRWRSGKYGTEQWRFFVLRGGDDSATICKIPGVEPGAEVLADVSGKERVHRLFEAVDQIEALGIAPSDVAPWFWVQTNASINSGLKPPIYTSEMHKAFLQELELSA